MAEPGSMSAFQQLPLRAEQMKPPTTKLGAVSGVFIPVCLNIFSILMFLRFGWILGQVGLLGIIGLLVTAYLVNFLAILSLSAIASNGEVKGGGAYYLISRSLGPEFGGSIGVLFYLAQVLNAALNIVGLIDCIRIHVGDDFPQGYWTGYGLQTIALLVCTALGLAGSGALTRTSNALLLVLALSILSIPISAIFKAPFQDEDLGIEFTGLSMQTLVENFAPHVRGKYFRGLETFQDLFGVLYPATSGIFAGASMSNDLTNPSKAIPKGTLWAMLTTFIAYLVVIFSLASSSTHASLLKAPNIIAATSLSSPLIFVGEIAITFVSAVLALTGSAKLLLALAKDELLPGLSVIVRKNARTADKSLVISILATYAIAQFAMLANLNQIAAFISMGFLMTFLVMNVACFLLKIGSAPNFRPAFKFFNWETALAGSVMAAAAMFFIDGTYAALAVIVLVFLFSLIHYLSPPKQWGDVSQNLIYHQVRKYLLRLRPEHIKFWRPQIILLINNPRNQTRLIQFCNSMKKGSLYILGHVIVTSDFDSGIHEARLQQAAWTNYISESSRIKAFVQLTMSPSINWGIRNLILSAGLGGMRPNIAVVGFYNMNDLRNSNPPIRVPEVPISPTTRTNSSTSAAKGKFTTRRRRADTSARLLSGVLPTDVIKTEDMMSVTSYMTMLEDLALKHKLNVAVGKGFENLETPHNDKTEEKKYIDLWPIQMSAEVISEGKSVLTTNFDTYTLILQLGFILNTVPAWKRSYKLRVMVFVEYESEVAQEHARVKALLDKLRIEANVLVFWLACGEIATYEFIVNGHSDDIDTQIMVNEVLRDEQWWDELQMFRGRMNESTGQGITSLADIIESTTGRTSSFNPHLQSDGTDARRRGSVIDLGSLEKNPTVSKLSRLGISMGIHTSHLGNDILSDDEGLSHAAAAADEADRGPSSSSSELDLDEDDHDHAARTQRDAEMEETEPSRRPLLPTGRLGRTLSDDFMGSSISQRRAARSGRDDDIPEETPTTYGTISMQTPADIALGRPSRHNTSQSLGSLELPGGPEVSRMLQSPSTTSFHPPLLTARKMEGSTLPTFPELPSQETSGTVTPVRPSMSRQSSAMRFSSRPVPETKVAVEEGSGPTIMFADEPLPMPTRSRRSSIGNLSMPPPALESGLSGLGLASNARSRRDSLASNGENMGQGQGHGHGHGHVPLDMSAIMERYRLDARWPEGDEEGAPYATQALPLSFNDLPSRAQHLILNELMQSQSGDTAVLFTTLPIPIEGTCLDAEASVQYLSDIEVLCHGLPPVLLVHSNSMTVTVGL